jgi:hypothetical protein
MAGGDAVLTGEQRAAFWKDGFVFVPDLLTRDEAIKVRDRYEVRACACMHVSVHTRTCARMHVSTHTRTCQRTYMRTYRQANARACDRQRARAQGMFAGSFDTGVYPDEWHWRKGTKP